MVAFLQAHGSQILTFLGAVLVFVVGIHPSWNGTAVELAIAKLLGVNVPPPSAPPAPPAA